MKKIVYQEKFAFIYLTKEFYNINQIGAAISNYKDFIEHNIGELGKYFVLKISLKNDDYTLKMISEEILNYILSEEYQIKGAAQ
ncbi:MAG: hypothetical protein HRU03_06020 [Nanoarchaeales archaeon]|nr:hypothetical protein [Nanoarchaeales archaeon]